ncbi:uncharacterized protein LOC133744669 [Rosa rugosa]|uniref:uncharacterized protein LOC133744669 n=1 Tax=Rosa rugosa TaxID=74645 RepID=UPI002B4019C3|nr:uncharacterized protein LOC133744669 [Rosa rugosa]
MDKSWVDWADWCSKPYRAKLEDFLNFAYHLHGNGFWKKYKIWDKHGESRDGANSLHRAEMFMGSNDYMEEDMVRLVQEAIGTANVVRPHDESGGESSNPLVGPNESTKQFLKLMKSANLPLYPGSKKHTTLSFIVKLLQAKVLNGWTDKSFKDLLDICNESMPEGVNLPNSYYQAQKLTEDLGFTYNTVDACPNSCMLFRNEDINLDQCLICKASRWKEDGCSLVSDLGPGKRKAAKQARYFPLKPRLQRLFMSSKTATLMRWHAEKRTNDGVFRHPADSLAWKDFDKKHPSFSGDIRNVRLGLASDGFNPFRTMNIVHSTWPVILVPYNLPPIMLMKQPFIYLSVFIDGPKGPGDKIDVYLQPLIEELKELWDEGIETFDASSNQMFQMHAALLWTINDFPAYNNLSGWSTKGEYACPSCNSETASIWLPNGKKFSYGSSRRFLPYDHKYWKDPRSFNGLREYRRSPTTLSGVDLLTQLQSNEKNVCDNVLGTILGVAGKSKDNISSRRDLELMGIREQYHVKRRESGSEYFNPADFEMNNDGKDKFLVALSETRMPDGSASHIARRQLIPLSVRSSLPKKVVEGLIDLGKFFKIFPPSFFDVMEHLPVHLVQEALIAGAVQFRWMYPIEREHLTAIKQQFPDADDHYVQHVHFDEFATWFKDHVITLQNTSDILLSEEIIALSSPPSPLATKVNSYTSNGCDSIHPVVGIKLDPFNFTLVNFNRLLYRNDRVGDEPFILTSQAQQVWYAPDPSGQGWLNVVEMESKNFSHVQTDNTEENDSSGELMDGVEMDE